MHGNKVTCRLSFPNNGFYLFVMYGKINVAYQAYTYALENPSEYDALDFRNTDEIRFEAITYSKNVLIEVPMA